MSDQREILDIQKQLRPDQRSALQKYRQLIVGRPGWWALIKYELICTLFAALPGALGLLLRRAFYPRVLGSVGRNVVFGTNVTLRHPHKIFIGDNVVIDDNCLLDAKGDTNRGITIGSGVFIGRNTILHCKNGDITVGDQANIGFNCDIASSNRVTIGAKVLIAAYSYLVGGGHDYSRTDTAIMDQQRVAHGISIGERCWIGAHVTVIDGVTVGAETIVGTGAVVNDNLPAGAVAVGMPARVIRLRSGTETPPADASLSADPPLSAQTGA